MYRLVVQLLQPYTLAWLLAVVAFVYAWRRHREARGRLVLLGIPLLWLLLLSTPAVAHLAVGSLEWQYAPLEAPPEDVDHVVVLSGSIRPPGPGRTKPEPDEDTLQRCLHALELYRRRPCRLVLSGGHCDPACPEVSNAAVMRDFFRQHGIPEADLVLEESSRTTHENAVGCREVLEPLGVRRVVLVTEAAHMYRSVLSFRRQGFDVTAAPCNYHLRRFGWSLHSFLPEPGAAANSQGVCHEWLGTLWYWWNERI